MGGFRCSRQVIFLAATASKAWEPLSVAAASNVHYVFATALVLCEAMKLLLLLPAVLLSSARAGRAAGVSWRAAALHYGLPSLLLGVCNLGLGYAVPRLGALLYQVVFQVSTIAATGALAVALLGQRLTAGQWGALGLLTVASIGAAHSRLGGGGERCSRPRGRGVTLVSGPPESEAGNSNVLATGFARIRTGADTRWRSPRTGSRDVEPGGPL